MTGITTSFDLDDTPEKLNRAELPALIHLPGGGENVRQSFDNNFWTFVHTVRVVLFYKPESTGRLEENLPGIVDIIDAYVTSFRAYNTLGGEVTDAVVESYGAPGVFEFGGIAYHGVEFTLGVTSYE